jgi:dolichyl-phosphate beta-glucosyltransferase
MSAATVVVPCYNEGSRLDEAAFAEIVRSCPDLELLFVNDGSTDNTAARLAHLCMRAPARTSILNLERNKGKAEAVRRGLEAALDNGAHLVGYYDADLATPPQELVRMILMMQAADIDVMIGSRVLLLGRSIERSNFRHYLGRVFATAASLVLRIAVYDTQCGAKLFRRSPQLSMALRDPFLSRWAFDVELLGRMLAGAPNLPGLSVDRIIEEPLHAWRDVPGSKLRGRHMAAAVFDMARIAIDLAQRRTVRREPHGS